ncbi:MAG: MFS transporter [Campylobacteraceae bacterium 4484_166]|nr:MAG: MFS transporter [Campylobacteraceae bacterium 4484_166]
MFNLDHKFLFVGLFLLFLTTSVYAKKGEYIPSAVGTMSNHPTIDGGVYHPVKNGKTGPYKINEKTLKGGYKFGRKPTSNELKAWDTDIMADGTGLPEGSGTVEDGEELYEAQCVSCHGDFGSGGGGYPALSKGSGYNMQKTLKNQRNRPDADGPVRVFGSYWPQASTLWWYIRDGMPHTRSKTLKDDEVYALVAYILNINEIKIDGKLVDDEYELTREKFLKIKMPNVDGFEPKIDGKGSLERVRKYYKNPKNFGAIKVAYAKRCMKNCQKKSAKIVRVRNGGIKDFHPPLSNKKDKPALAKDKLNVKKVYDESCAMCHANDSMQAPVAGKKSDWQAKMKNGGIKGVYKRGIKGLNVMPPKGGTTLSDDEFKKVVDYMINLK